MVDGGAFDGDKAYKDSKLCNVLFTRELSRRMAASGARGVTVNCLSPGLITKSGLFRNRESSEARIRVQATTEVFWQSQREACLCQCLTLPSTTSSKSGKQLTLGAIPS